MAPNAVQLIEAGFRAREMNIDPADSPYSNKRHRRMFRAWMTGWVIADREIVALTAETSKAIAVEKANPRKVVSIRR